MVSKDEVASRGVGTSSPVETFCNAPQNEVKVFFGGMMFLTRLPCPGFCDHHPGYTMRGFSWFPAIGAVIGGWAAVWFDAAIAVWPEPAVAACLSTSATIWLTGCFHEDGLGDTLDGFGGGWTKAQILRIMKDSRVGSYAAVGLSMWMMAKVALLSRLASVPTVWALGGSSGVGPALVVAHSVARMTGPPLLYTSEYVLDDDDAKKDFYIWFGQFRRVFGPVRLVASALSAAAVAFAILPPHRAAAVLGTTSVCTVFAGLYSHSVLGGVMGDFLGATTCITETAIYLILISDPARLAAASGPLLRLGVTVLTPYVYGRFIRKSK